MKKFTLHGYLTYEGKQYKPGDTLEIEDHYFAWLKNNGKVQDSCALMEDKPKRKKQGGDA